MTKLSNPVLPKQARWCKIKTRQYYGRWTLERDRWTQAAIVLVAISAAIFLFEKAWQLGGFFGDIILTFALAWLVAFILDPWLMGSAVALRHRSS